MGDAATTANIVDVEVLEPQKHNREGCKPANARSEEEVFAVLDEVVHNGGNVTKAARDLGIPLRTVQSWLAKYKEERDTFAEIQRMQLAEHFGRRAKELVCAITKAKIEKASAKDLGIVAGIFADKFRELTGRTSTQGDFNLKIAWKDGSGALELSTKANKK